MRKSFFSVLFCSFLLSTPLSASLVEDTQSVESSTEVLETSEQQKTSITRDELANQVYGDVMDKISQVMPRFSGYIQSGYVWNDKNAGDNSTFQMKRMRLFIDKKISDIFDIRAQFEVFSGSTDAEYKKRLMTVMDAYINAHLSKEVHFRLGQYFLPLGFENYDLSPMTLETIDFSSITNRMVCRNAVSTPNLIDYGRDIGIMMYGDLFQDANKKFNYLSYALSLTNGQLPTLNDNNKSKDFVGRLTFRPIEKLRILGSYNWGEYQKLGNEETVKTKNYVPMGRIVAGAWYYDPEGLSLRAEYGHLKSKDAGVKEDSFYALAAYKIDKFLPVVRWDMYRDRQNKYASTNVDALLVGCTYQIIKDVKIQAAYTYSIYTDKAKDSILGSKTGNGNGFQIMCLAKF